MLISFKQCAVLALVALDALADAVSLRQPLRPSNDPFYEAPANIDDVAHGTTLKPRKPPSPIAAFGTARVNIQDIRQILIRPLTS